MAKSSDNSKSNLNRIREHFNQSGGGEADQRWFNVKEPEGGKERRVKIRVLPAWGKGAIVDGIKLFYFTGALHYGFSIGGRNRALACPEASDRGPCPVCKFISKIKRADNDNLMRLIEGKNNIRQSRRYWVNVLVRDGDDADRGVLIYGANKKFIEAIIDFGDDYGDVTHPTTGRDITIIRKGKGFNTRYRYVVAPKQSVVQVERKDMHQLDKEVQEWISYEDMMKYLVENYGDEMREVGMSTKIGKKKVAKKVEEDDDEDSVEDDSDEGEDTEDEDEDEEVDEEDEEESDDEEDEEEDDDEE